MRFLRPFAFAFLFVVLPAAGSPASAKIVKGPVDPRLPVPILEDDPDLIELYWTAWEIALRHVKQPAPGSGLVSPFMDDAFSGNIYQWDTAFMVLFGRYGQDAVPGARSFDNFYARQAPDGFIDREIREADGSYVWGPEHNNAINPPLFSWAEWEAYRISGDASRLKRVYPRLKRYYEWVKSHRRLESGLYWTTNLASGMDNSPRCMPDGDDSGLHYGYSWADLTAQQALNALHLARIAERVGEKADIDYFLEDYRTLEELVNANFWSEEEGIYFDLNARGELTGVKTAASFWPMLAEIAPPERARRLVKEHLMDPDEFWRPHPFPTLSKDSPYYDPTGGYWRGSVWAPTEYAIIRGLANYGYDDFASAAARRHLKKMRRVLALSGTIFENYSPELDFEGRPSSGDFVGWSGIGPIAMLIENIIGIRMDAPEDLVVWRVRRTDRHGLENFRFGDNGAVSMTVSARKRKTDPVEIQVRSDNPLNLRVELPSGTFAYAVPEGESRFTAP